MSATPFAIGLPGTDYRIAFTGSLFCFRNSGGTARIPVTLPPIHTATDIDWHYITPWHILKNTPL